MYNETESATNNTLHGLSSNNYSLKILELTQDGYILEVNQEALTQILEPVELGLIYCYFGA